MHLIFLIVGYPKTSVTKGHKGVLTLSLCPRLRIRLHYYFFIELVMIILTDEYIYISMKKLLLSLLLILPLCGFAQKGMQGIGVATGYGSSLNSNIGDPAILNFSLGIIYQNYITEDIRLSTSLGMVRTDAYNDYYDWSYNRFYHFFGVDVHYFFNSVKRLMPYVVGGFSAGSFSWNKPEQETAIASGAKLGVGLNYRLGYHLTAQLEVPLYAIWPEYWNSMYYCFPSLSLIYTF